MSRDQSNTPKWSTNPNQAGPSTSRVLVENMSVKKPKLSIDIANALTDSESSNDSQGSIEYDPRKSSRATEKRKSSDNHADNSQPEWESKRLKYLVDEIEMPSDGLKLSLHGCEFQLNLLMLVSWRAWAHKLSEFRLATEQPESEKFDDVAFFYKRNHADIWKVRLFQAKHKEGNRTEFIARSNLLSTDNENPFALQKYFKSYQKIDRRCRESSLYSPFSGAEVEDITIITNADLYPESLKQCFEMDSHHDIEKDDFIGFDSFCGTKKYSLCSKSSMANELIPIFNNTSDFNELIQLLAQSAVNNRPIDKSMPPIKDYLFALKRDVLEYDDVVDEKEYQAKFKQDFFDSKNPSDEVLQFRESLIREVAFLRSSWNFRISNKFDVEHTLTNQKALRSLTAKLAAALEKKEELKAADYPDSRVFLASRVVNCNAGKFRSNFINPNNDLLRNFRDMLKSDLIRIRQVKKITNKDLTSMQIRVSEDFHEMDLPFQLDKLNRLADAFVGAMKRKGPLDPSPFPDLKNYQSCLATQVLDMSKCKGFNINFISGELDEKGSEISVLSNSTMEFRRILIPKILSDKNLIEAQTFLRDAKILISKGLADDLRNKPSRGIRNSKEFAQQIYNILTTSANGLRNLEISANSISGTSDELELFKANVCALGAERVLVEKFSKIRFSTAFIGGSITILRTELINLFGSKFQTELPEYSFRINFKAFRADPEESITQMLPVPYIQEDFQNFFNKLRIVVRYPSRFELANRLEMEMKDSYRNLNSKALNALLKGSLQNWMSDRIGTFYTAEKVSCLFSEIDRAVLCWPLHGMNQSYFAASPRKYSFKVQDDYNRIVRFLTDPTHHVLNLVFEHLLLGRIRLVQTFFKLQMLDLEETKRYTRMFGHIFFKLQQFDKYRFYKDVVERLQDPNQWNLIVVECNGHKRRAYDRLSKSLGSGGINRKVILLTQPKDHIEITFNTSDPQTIQKAIVTTCFYDLDDSSQARIGEKGKVSLQESALVVNQLIDNSLRRLIDATTLLQFITDGRIRIGNNLQYPDGYEPAYYIDRFFNVDVEIKDEVRIRCRDILIVSDDEDEFIRACERREDASKKSIHWLQSVSGKLIWQKTNGCIATLVKYRGENKRMKEKDFITTDEHVVKYRGDPISKSRLINTPMSRHTTSKETEFLTIDDNQKLMIISDCAGMGKTTIMSNFSKHLKSKFANLWVIRIDLNDYSPVLDEELTARKLKSPRLHPKDQNSAIAFLLHLLQSNDKSKLKTDFEVNLFENALKQPSQLKFAILLDAFDEISPSYAEIVLELVQGLRLTHVQKLIITTRPTMQERLECGLNTFAYRLRQFSQSEQETFLRKFWTMSIKFAASTDFHERLGIYIAAILQKQCDSIDDKEMEFTGIPLQLRLLAEIFQEAEDGDNWQGCRDFLVSSNPVPELPKRLNTFDLFQKFVQKKYMIYSREKMRQDMTNEAVKIETRDSFRTFVKQHQRLSLYTIFNKDDLEMLLLPFGDYDEQMEEIMSYMDRIESGQEMRGLVNRIVNDKPHFVHRTVPEYFIADYVGIALTKRVQHRQFHESFIQKILASNFQFRSIRSFFEAWLAKEKALISENTKINLGQCIIDIWLKSGKTLTGFLHNPCEEGSIHTFQLIVECLRNHSEHLKEIVNTESSDTTMLYAASMAKNLDIIKILVLQCGAEVDTLCRGQSVLQSAASSGRVDICKWLAMTREEGGAGADMHSIDDQGRTTLDKAITSGNLELCQWLVSRGLKIKSADRVGRTPIHGAVLGGHLPIAQWLISTGVGANECDQYGRNILHYACITGQLKIVQWLVKPNSEGGCGMDIHFRANNNRSVLHTASTASNLDLLQWLLDIGFDVNAPDTFGLTPLLLAAQLGHLKVVQWLLNKGAEIKAATKNGMTVLHLAANARKPDLCLWLIDEGLDPTIANHDHMLPIQLAATKGHLAIVERLLQDREPNHGTHENGNSLLHFAALCGRFDVCARLLQHESIRKAGLNINSRGKNGSTMLLEAARTNTRLIQWLLNNGADAECRDDDGQTVLHYATAFGKLEICKWLTKSKEEGGGGLEARSIKDNHGNTVLHTAAYSGSLRLCQWLVNTMGLQVLEENVNGENGLYVAEKYQHMAVASWMKSITERASSLH